MKTLSAPMLIHLDGEVLTLATCLKLTLLDGTQLGFCDHDRDLEVGDLVYEAATSVMASSLRSSLDAGVDNMDVGGLISSDRITEEDLLAGRYDSAAFELFQINWMDISMGRIIHVTGTLGDVTFSDGRFRTELRSLTQRLAQQVGDLTSPGCIVKRLADEDCLPPDDPSPGFDIADFRHNRTVFSVTSSLIVTFDSDVFASGYYDYGVVLMTSGPNLNIEREIKSHTIVTGRARVVLQESFPYLVSVGETARLEAGCDRRISTCRLKFTNSKNHRGMPDLPGNDAVLQRGRR